MGHFQKCITWHVILCTGGQSNVNTIKNKKISISKAWFSFDLILFSLSSSIADLVPRDAFTQKVYPNL